MVTDLATFGFDEETGEMTLLTLHPGVTLDDVRANMGWDPRLAERSGDARAERGGAPADPLELDPEGVYTS